MGQVEKAKILGLKFGMITLAVIAVAGATQYDSSLTDRLKNALGIGSPKKKAQVAQDVEPVPVPARATSSDISSGSVPDPRLVPSSRPDFLNPLWAPLCADITASIVVESTEPKLAFAALKTADDAEAAIRRLGDEVAGRRVAFIGFNPRSSSSTVWLTRGADVCQVPVGKDPKANVPAAPSASPGMVVPPPAPAEIAAKIQKVGDTKFKVDRSVVDSILESQAELWRSDRVVAETRDGEVVGMRMFGIPSDSVLGILGLVNGDRLEAIDGANMQTPEKVLDAYLRFRRASSLSVRVTRKGHPVTIDYAIE